MKPFSITSALVLALLTAPTLSSAAVERPAPSHDGTWSVSIETDSDKCRAGYTLPVEVTAGEVSYAGRFRVAASGAVQPTGKLNVTFSHNNNVVEAKGQLEESFGFGSWTSPTKDCGGTWIARRS